MAAAGLDFLGDTVSLLQVALDTAEQPGPSARSAPPRAPPPTVAGQLLPCQRQMVSSFMRSPSNQLIFLPTGLGGTAVVDAIVGSTLERHSDKHVVVCVVRPAQALTHAERLRTALGVPATA